MISISLSSHLPRSILLALMLICTFLKFPGLAHQEQAKVFFQYYGDAEHNLERTLYAFFLTHYGRWDNSFQVSYSHTLLEESYFTHIVEDEMLLTKSEKKIVALSNTYYIRRLTSFTTGYSRLEGNFFDGNQLTFNFSQGFWNNNTVFDMGYAYLDRDYYIGAGKLSKAGLTLLGEEIWLATAKGVTASYTQVLTRTTIFKVGGAWATETKQPDAWEAYFDFRQHLPINAALHLSYRHFENENEIKANTYEFKWHQYITLTSRFAFRYRYYQEDDYSRSALDYLEEIEGQHIFNDRGVYTHMFGIQFTQDILGIFPDKWNLFQHLAYLNVVLKFDYYKRQQDYLNIEGEWKRNGVDRIGRVYLIGFDVYFN